MASVCDIDDFVKDADDCVCQKAVTRAYHGMIQSGTDNDTAMDAASRVYHYHHPEVSLENSRQIVERLVNAMSLH